MHDTAIGTRLLWWRREGDLNPRGPERPQADWCLPVANISRFAPCLFSICVSAAVYQQELMDIF